MFFPKHRPAFTIIELLVTIVVVSMLSSIGVATYNKYITSSKITAIKSTVNDLYRYTVLMAKENDQYYSELPLEQIIDRFGMTKPKYGNIVYVASDTDFFYQATLPNGDNYTLGLITKTYAENYDNLNNSNSYYAEGTPRGMRFFAELNNSDREKFNKAASDKYILNNILSDKRFHKDYFHIKKVGAPWQETPLDSDRDGVPDYRDKCPKTIGELSNKGCPLVDTDGDGVLDNKDDCPKTKGDKYNFGCPLSDKDKDGIWDGEDKCPEKPGLKDNNGCPLEKK